MRYMCLEKHSHEPTKEEIAEVIATLSEYPEKFRVWVENGETMIALIDHGERPKLAS